MSGERRDLWQRLRPYLPAPDALEPEAEGRLVRSVGLTLEAVGLNLSVGRQCLVIARDGRKIEAEVVGFAGASVYLMPVKRVEGLEPGARVVPVSHTAAMRIGLQTLGRVINGIGQPLDGKGALAGTEFLDQVPSVINPLNR